MLERFLTINFFTFYLLSLTMLEVLSLLSYKKIRFTYIAYLLKLKLKRNYYNFKKYDLFD